MPSTTLTGAALRQIRRRPSDRFYATLHWICLAIIAGFLLHGFVLARFIDTPRPVGFRLVVLAILAFNALWWSVADRRIARFVASDSAALSLRLLIAAFVVAINIPIVVILIKARIPAFVSMPTWYVAAITLWHLGLACLMPVVAAARLILLGALAAIQRVRKSIDDTNQGRPENDGGTELGRRALLKTAFASVPVAMLAGGTVAAKLQEGRVSLHRHSLPAPWLPDRLRGLTITHISDLHVGRLYRPSMLRSLVDRANEFDSDIVVVTGDLVDTSNDMLPATIRALAQLDHRYGLFASIGNHDEIDNRPEFIEYTRRFLPLLINQRRSLAIAGERLTIAGLDFAHGDAPYGRNGGNTANVAAALHGHDPRHEGPVIALAHHPHTWDRLADRQVPLTLSGHTHGGQVMFTPPGERPDIGVGRLLFRYTRGFYKKPGSMLFVNSGVGNWFPLRIHAPAEIVQIQLI